LEEVPASVPPPAKSWAEEECKFRARATVISLRACWVWHGLERDAVTFARYLPPFQAVWNRETIPGSEDAARFTRLAAVVTRSERARSFRRQTVPHLRESDESHGLYSSRSARWSMHSIRTVLSDESPMALTRSVRRTGAKDADRGLE